MLAIIKTINGVKKIVKVTADTGAGNPVGSLLHTYKKSNPSGYLYCDGSTFDQTKYPLLYAYLGSNVLPDYREVVEVGAEQNTTDTIATHDVYTEGQFKDDQLQDHSHTVNAQSVAVSGSGVVMYGSEYSSEYTTNTTSGRTGTTTHGKQKAVFVYIKATSGLSENAQDNVLATINENNSYSTTEHATGKKWIDGKPIYAKTFVFENINLTSSPQTIGNSGNINVANIIKKETVVKNITNGILSSDNQGFVYIANGNDICGLQTLTSTTSGWYVYYTVEYTKT